jgi:hypothetical protein
LFVRGDMDEASYSLACMRKCLLPKACRAERDSCVTLRVTWSGHFFDISVDVVAVGVLPMYEFEQLEGPSPARLTR